jgi:predicted dehydrogenase
MARETVGVVVNGATGRMGYRQHLVRSLLAKPTADSLDGALELAHAARDAGVVRGVVADKLYLPGLRKLRRLIDGGFFGRILSVRVEFGYWVFEGDRQPAQRPSWNYRTADGGGIALDMFPHWNYLLESLFGPIRSVYCTLATHIPQRWDERGEAYAATADAAYAILELDGGVVASVNASWTTRINRDELLEIHVDGVDGSAVAGLRGCKVQPKAVTPRPVWDPDVADPESFPEQWSPVPDNALFDNGFKAQWELFLADAYRGKPFWQALFHGAGGVQLALLALASAREGRRLPVPPMEQP